MWNPIVTTHDLYILYYCYSSAQNCLFDVFEQFISGNQLQTQKIPREGGASSGAPRMSQRGAQPGIWG